VTSSWEKTDENEWYNEDFGEEDWWNLKIQWKNGQPKLMRHHGELKKSVGKTDEIQW
jgi:hypothetical protein